MNSDSPLNWDKIANSTLPASNNINEVVSLYPSFSYNAIVLILVIILTFFGCIFIYQQNKDIYSPNLEKSCDDDDYKKWD
jgi:hypothetical protein